MATLTLKKVSKTFAIDPILQNIDLEINDGEMIVIVGPSGCGKSTLLRLIAGLETLSEGEIRINDKAVNHLAPNQRNIAMVFQNYALYPHMTVYQNMAYGLRMRGFTKQQIAEQVNKTAETLQLSDLLQRKPRELSGGQRQRVAMGRAIVRQPDIFLFDEPLSNLDASLRVKMRLEIKKLQQQLRTTSVYVTHDQVEAMTLADRLVVFNQGKIEQIGTPLAIYEKPASIFVGGFLGSPAMNFLPAKLSEDGKHILLSPEIRLPSGIYAYRAGQEVILGIRPEHFTTEFLPGADRLLIEIEMIETLGSNTLLYGHVPSAQKQLVVRMPANWIGSRGEKIELMVMPECLHLFDKKTGARI